MECIREEKRGHMKKDTNFENTRRQFCALVIGLACIGLLLTFASADPIPAPDAGLHQHHGTVVNTTTAVQVPDQTGKMAVSAQGVSKTSMITTTVGSGEHNTSPIGINWLNCFGGSDYDGVHSLIPTSDGGYLFSGYTMSTDGDVTGNHGIYDYWVVKLNSTGSIEWQKCLGGSDSDGGVGVNQTADGGYLVCGYPYSNDGDVIGNHGYDDSWTVKLSGNGSVEWKTCLGGTAHDWGWEEIQTSDGGYLVGGGTGSYDGNVTGMHGVYDAWIQKLSTNGTLQWQKCLGGTKDDGANTVLQTSDGGYLAGGYVLSDDGDVTSNHGYYDAWIVKLNTTGSIDWQKTYGGSGEEDARTVIHTDDGGFLFAGYTNSTNGDVVGNHGDYDTWIVKINATGTIDWQKTYGGSGDDEAESVIRTSDGEYLVSGYTNSNDGDVTGNHGGYDAWIIKIDANGNLKWQKTVGGTEDDDARSTAVQVDNSTYLISGSTYSNDGDVTGNHGSFDIWIASLSTQDTEENTPSIDMETLLSPTGSKPGTSTLGSLSKWTFTTIDADQTNTSNQTVASGQIKALFTVNPTEGPAPLTVACTSTSLGNPTSFSWDFGDGTTSGLKNPVHTYTTPGTYSISLRAMNAKTGGVGVMIDAITVTESRQFATKYTAPGTA